MFEVVLPITIDTYICLVTFWHLLKVYEKFTTLFLVFLFIVTGFTSYWCELGSALPIREAFNDLSFHGYALRFPPMMELKVYARRLCIASTGRETARQTSGLGVPVGFDRPLLTFRRPVGLLCAPCAARGLSGLRQMNIDATSRICLGKICNRFVCIFFDAVFLYFVFHFNFFFQLIVPVC